MEINNLATRQTLGCGFEPPAVAPLVASPWAPDSTGTTLGFDGDVTVCAGYSTRMPELVEISRARHWSTSGQLTDAFCAGETPTERLMEGVEILDGAYGRFEKWQMTAVADGGGRK